MYCGLSNSKTRKSVSPFQEELTVTSGKLIPHCILSFHLCCTYHALSKKDEQRSAIHYKTLNVHGANTTHGTESEVFREKQYCNRKAIGKQCKYTESNEQCLIMEVIQPLLSDGWPHIGSRSKSSWNRSDPIKATVLSVAALSSPS